MIKASELRIGNWVIWPSVDKSDALYMKVNYITENNIEGWKDSDLQPIPITPEILEKCGFSLSFGADSFYELLSDNGVLFIEGDKNGKCEVFLDWDDKIRVQYLHQLQNLYFALTGTELQIKL